MFIISSSVLPIQEELIQRLCIFMYPRIRNLREDADMNQTQVAKYLGMSQTGYSKYETGENDIPTAILIKLSKLYDVSIDYILGISDKKK